MAQTQTSGRVSATAPTPGSRDVIGRWAFQRWVMSVAPAS